MDRWFQPQDGEHHWRFGSQGLSQNGNLSLFVRSFKAFWAQPNHYRKKRKCEVLKISFSITKKKTAKNLHFFHRKAFSKSIKELEFVKHCRSLDISLADIKRLIELKNKPEESCSSVNALINRQLMLVNQRMKELKALRKELQNMAKSCPSDNTVDACNIMKSLDG
mgnify:CR=1 FL=1